MAQNKHYAKNKSNSLLKQIICIFASFLLAVTLLVIALFTSLQLGYANKDSVIQAFKNSNYYNRIYTTTMSNCENEAIISGLGNEIFEGVFSLDEMTNHCNTYVLSYLNGDTYTIDTSAMEEKLSENIKNYAAANNLAVDGDIDTVINSFTSTVIAYYKTALQFPYFDQVVSVFRLFHKLSIYVLPCMIIFTIVLIILLWRLNTFKKNRTFRYLAYGFISASLSILVIPVFSYVTGFYKKILLKPDYIYYYMVSYFQDGLKTFIVAGIILFVLGLICIATSTVIKAKLKKEHVPAHHREQLSDSI